MEYDDFSKLKTGKATLPEIAMTLDQYVSVGAAISSEYVIELIEKTPDQSSAFAYLSQMENACNIATTQPHRTNGPSDRNHFRDLGNWIKSRILSLR